MADTKISALTAATTPLAGTEVLPIVQSGTTKQVSVANLTTGRTVTVDTLVITSGSLNLAGGGANGFISGNTWYGINSGNWVFQAGNASQSFVWANTSGTAQVTLSQSTGNLTFNTGNVVQGTAAKGINFTANSAAAGMTSQLLNWYEEGTFTPTAYGGTSTGTTTYSARNGNYTRIGNVITVWVEISITAMTGTGNLRLGNFPYTSSSTGSSSIGAVQTSGLTWSQSPSSSTVQVNQNANYAVIYNSVDNGGWGITSTKNGTWSVYFTVTYRI